MEHRSMLTWRRRMLPAALALAVAMLLPHAAVASASTVDQEQAHVDVYGGTIGQISSGAQTFTAGRTGLLDQVDLAFAENGPNPSDPLTVQIRNAVGNAPGSTVLASTTVTQGAVQAYPAFTSASFAAPANVTAGTQYAIVVSSVSFPTYDLRGVIDNPYAGGRLCFLNQETAGNPWACIDYADAAFRTYVAIPPPPPPPPSGVLSGPLFNLGVQLNAAFLQNLAKTVAGLGL